ncbi:small ribosomal subunit protein bS6m [Anoplolepis gracilipes]|uniref:small ribosomal subunit protein bS6m n=1 Tax=Anoplolepis gracilipes TaxID=354296 RepID=UPI003BA37247
MPTYEMPLILRVMRKPELVATLKRATTTIFNTGGFIRKIENWGVKPLPCKINAHGRVHKEANHFLIHFDIPPKEIDKIVDEYNRDTDIIRSRVFKQREPIKINCTFHDEMLPPPYRSSVQKLMELAKKQHNNKYDFKYNSGLDYYPFNK